MNKRTIAVALGAAALAVPAAAVAQPGHGKDKPPKKAKTVNFVFKGTFNAPGTVTVSAGNAHVRKGGYVGTEVTFDLDDAKIVGVDTTADGKVDLADVADGDKVLVQARVAKGTKHGTAPASELAARKLVDQTRAQEPEVPTP
ncbi:MAG TPA: hypothetical protein VEY49_10870 [Solirubrobacteraceae bacterium]|nr:hypothetical protein [Solirubrobacteraceae bacterium]